MAVWLTLGNASLSLAGIHQAGMLRARRLDAAGPHPVFLSQPLPPAPRAPRPRPPMIEDLDMDPVVDPTLTHASAPNLSRRHRWLRALSIAFRVIVWTAIAAAVIAAFIHY